MSRLSEDPLIKSTGMIIDTSGVISQGKGGYEIISHIVSEFAGMCLTFHDMAYC